jgi:hypothetical protein
MLFALAGYYVASACAETCRMVFYEAGRVGNNARSGLEDGENLAFGNDIVEFDENRRELACGGRGYRDFHLHGLDEGDVVAIGDAGSGLNRKRADASRYLGNDPDIWHSIPQRPGPAAIALVNGFLLWPQIA